MASSLEVVPHLLELEATAPVPASPLKRWNARMAKRRLNQKSSHLSSTELDHYVSLAELEHWRSQTSQEIRTHLVLVTGSFSYLMIQCQAHRCHRSNVSIRNRVDYIRSNCLQLIQPRASATSQAGAVVLELVLDEI